MVKLFFKPVFFLLIAELLFSTNSISQAKKYPSLFWEITGNGLKTPSYLFGTMHVSNKLVFNLPDSFYHAIKSVEAVALELNPDVWQGQMVKLDQLQLNYKNFTQAPRSDYLNEKSFQLEKYEDDLKAALSSEPTVVNSLLYRSFKSREDFEEDTFLDLYIFQTGKKLGKRTTGVENYYETEKIMIEAYADMAKEKNRKRIDTDGESMMGIVKKMENAYRAGDLDLLDSLSDMTDVSDAFRNKFLYKRNEIQAYSIDTILKKNSLFVGVGAAHLAGDKGIIEILRRMGYNLRPIVMSERSSVQKEKVDKLKVPVNFIANVGEDDFYEVEAPGPLYKMASDVSGLDRRQYADMTNGSYYMLTRIKTHASFIGHSVDDVLKKIDSLLYENIPGKIIKKENITKNGYKGFDITNRTRRGDIQRYQIFVTPFEVLVFKMSGKENYVEGPESERFFTSIKLNEISKTLVSFEPSQGGFKVKLPNIPSQFLNRSTEDNIDRWEYEAFDKETGNAYLILKKAINNFRFLEEDSLDLNLMEESFRSSPFIANITSSKSSKLSKYPALDVQATLKDGRQVSAKFIIKGSDLFMLAVAGKNTAAAKDFFSSFQFTPFKYSASKVFVDTFLQYKASTPVVPELENELRALIEQNGDAGRYGLYNTETYWPKAKNALFKSDSTGELISVTMQQYPKYFYIRDSASFWRDEINDYITRTDFILAKKEPLKKADYAGYNLAVRDTNSSRQINRTVILKNDRLYRIISVSDTTTDKSDFIKNFYSSFQPRSKQQERNIFTSTFDNFLTDFFSSDSTIRSKAQSAISNIFYTKNDIVKLVNTINQLHPSDKDYIENKSRFIAELGYIKDTAANTLIIKSLRSIYEKAVDTSSFQNAVLKALAKKKTKESYQLLKHLLIQDPPVFANRYEYGSFFNDIKDSLLLAKQLFPDILQLSTILDYKDDITALLVTLVDSNKITAKEYEKFYSNIYFDAKLELKKQQGRDEKKSDREDTESDAIFQQSNYQNSRIGLNLYAVLLMPFYDKPQVTTFFQKLMQSRNQSLKLNTAVLLLRNKKPVADSILLSLAAKDEYRGRLYRSLEKAKLLNKFPQQYRTQELIAKSGLASNKMDSIVYLSKKPVSFRNKNGVVYFYKYRIKKDDSWKIGISGLQPLNSNEITTDNRLVTLTDKRIKDDEPLNDQLELQLKRLMISQSRSGRNFYATNSFGFRREDF